MFEKLKEIRYWIITILVAIIGIVLFIILFRILKKQNKTLTIYPKLSIKSVENATEIDNNELTGIVRLGQEAIIRITKYKKK